MQNPVQIVPMNLKVPSYIKEDLRSEDIISHSTIEVKIQLCPFLMIKSSPKFLNHSKTKNFQKQPVLTFYFINYQNVFNIKMDHNKLEYCYDYYILDWK